LLAIQLGVLTLLSLYSYALFHTVVELYCTIIAAAVFLVVFHTRRLLDNDYLLFVGVGFLFVAIVGIPHMLGYKGVALFAGFDNDLPTQAFIAQRFLLATTFLVAPIFLRRRLKLTATIASFAAITSLLLLSLLLWRNFPHMFIDGTGITSLKKGLELVLSAVFVASGWLLLRRREAFDPGVLRLLLTSLVCFIASEVAFTLYATPFGVSNLGGHLLQIAGFYFTYRAVVVTALVTPFGLLFRELSNREHSLQEANAQLNAVADISDSAMSTLDLSELMTPLLERLVAAMHADAAIFLLAEEDSLRSFASVGLGDARFIVPIGRGFAGTIARELAPRHVHDARAGEYALDGLIRAQGIMSALGAPVAVGDKLIGVLHVDWRQQHDFTDSDLRLLTIVADRVAQAVRNTQAYEGEHRIAQLLQASLISVPDDIEDLLVAHTYHSATVAARVGGDFYDLFNLDETVVGMIIGDVSGKGIDAAVLTALVKNTIRAHAQDVNGSPAEAMRLTNAMVERYSEPGSFVTIFFGLLDRKNGRLIYCNAGHTPALALKCDGSVVKLASNSALVGAFPDLDYCDSEISLTPGETVVLYTDGVTEARRGRELYGENRLVRSFADATSLEPQALVDGLLAGLLEFTDGGLSDDLAVLVLKLMRLTHPTEETIGMEHDHRDRGRPGGRLESP
jgi:serine phosphatase RsbU (regulator of sigma subunit)